MHQWMTNQTVLFKGRLHQETQTLQLSLAHQRNSEFIEEFDRVVSKLPEIKISIAICLKSEQIDFSMDDDQKMYNIVTLCSNDIDPRLNGYFNRFIQERLVDSGTCFTRVYNDLITSKHDHEDDGDTGYDSDTSATVKSSHHVDLCELISKTGAVALEADATLDLIAVCACLVNSDWESAGMYLQALILHISRRHELRSRQDYASLCKRMEEEQEPMALYDECPESALMIAKDITMLFTFFRLCSFAAHQGVLLPLVNPGSFISACQAARPLFVVSDEEYAARLSKCTTAFQAAMCFVVYGRDDPDRMQASSEAFHEINHRERGSKYSATLTESSFRRIVSHKERISAFSMDTDVRHGGLRDELDRLAYEQGQRLVARLAVDESYSARYVRELPLDKPVIALKAACGTGKSVQMFKDIDLSEEEMAVVIISHRKALSAETQKRTARTKRGEFALYSNIDGKIDLNVHRNLICEYESLGRLLPFKGKFRVIIDEANSVLYQTQSAAGDTQAAHAVFVNLMRLADKVLIMDAFLDQDRINVWAQYVRFKPYVIENTFKPNQDHEIWLANNKNATKQRLVSLVEQGEKVIVPCTLKADAEEIYHLLCSKINPNEIQLYTAESRWQNGNDVNEIWSKARVVIHTSTMDSGHSFELDHFGWAVCFFSNSVQIPVESSLQMKSRSRLTKRFIINIEQQWIPVKYGSSSIDEIIAMIHKNERKAAETSCLQYYGEQAYWDVYRRDEHPTCPALVLHATMKMLMNRSMTNFRRLFYEMLREDGVQGANLKLLEGSGTEIAQAVKAAKKEVKAHAKIPTPHSLAGIFEHTPLQVFEAMDDEARRFYSNQKAINAYRNRIAIHSEGPDLPRALKNVKKKQNSIKAAIAVCRLNDRFDENSLFQTELKLGLLDDGPYSGMTSFYACSTIACTLNFIFTGLLNPFESHVMTTQSLHKNLLCTQRNSDSKEKRGYNIYDIDEDLCERIQELHDDFSSISNTGFRRKGKKSLSLTEGLTMLNDVLMSQFGIKYQANKNKQLRNGGVREYVYELNDAFIAPQTDILTVPRPHLIPWNSVIKEINNEDLLSHKVSCGKTVVCPGKAFDCWPVNCSESITGYMPLKMEHMGTFRDRQKRRIRHEMYIEQRDWNKKTETEQLLESQRKQALDDERNIAYSVQRDISNAKKLQLRGVQKAAKRKRSENAQISQLRKKQRAL